MTLPGPGGGNGRDTKSQHGLGWGAWSIIKMGVRRHFLLSGERGSDRARREGTRGCERKGVMLFRKIAGAQWLVCLLWAGLRLLPRIRPRNPAPLFFSLSCSSPWSYHPPPLRSPALLSVSACQPSTQGWRPTALHQSELPARPLALASAILTSTVLGDLTPEGLHKIQHASSTMYPAANNVSAYWVHLSPLLHTSNTRAKQRKVDGCIVAVKGVGEGVLSNIFLSDELYSEAQ